MRALERLVGASSAQRPLAERLPRRRPETAWGIAIIAPLLIALVSRLFVSSVPPATTLFMTLLAIVIAALLGGLGPALTGIVVGLLAQELFFSFPYGSLNEHRPAQIVVLVVFVLVAGGIGLVVDELARLTAEHAALRRIAAMVAGGVRPTELYSAVAKEVADLLGADSAFVAHLEPDGDLTILAAQGRAAGIEVGERVTVAPHTAVGAVVSSARTARIDDTEHTVSGATDVTRRVGRRSSVASPVVVDGRLWGVIEASLSRALLSADAEGRMLSVTELVATAIANAEAHAELTASRARVIAAADEARRRIERDLHDGAQQRLASVVLKLQTAQDALPTALEELRADLDDVADELSTAVEELRDYARGIHPAVLTNRGLGPALRALARRSVVPVELEVCLDARLPASIEAGAYYVVSEALTNTVKHAKASAVAVEVAAVDGVLRVSVRDDGVGGANFGTGSGLVGLQDRVAALGGRISLESARGSGTAIVVELPLEAGATAPRSPTSA